jgi:hypothetical protein
MGAGDKIRIAAHIEVEWLETQFAPDDLLKQIESHNA